MPLAQVLLPVVLMLFSNISIQASCGAWIYTYALRHVGLAPADAQAVTALYWASFTATRLVGVGAARCLHASTIMLLTTPAALAGAGLAVWGLPGSMDIDAGAGLGGLGGSGSPATSLPRSLLLAPAREQGLALPLLASGSSPVPGQHEVHVLYGVVVLVGVGVATGFANAVSMTADYIVLDGFINGAARASASMSAAAHSCRAFLPSHSCTQT